MSDWHTKFLVSRDAGLTKDTRLTKRKSHSAISCQLTFSPSDTRKNIKFDAFASRLSFHMQCAHDKCRING